MAQWVCQPGKIFFYANLTGQEKTGILWLPLQNQAKPKIIFFSNNAA